MEPNPVAGVTIGPGGVLYGTTEAGGDQSCGFGGGCGTVYSLRPLAQAVANAESPWIETVLYRFQGGHGRGGTEIREPGL